MTENGLLLTGDDVQVYETARAKINSLKAATAEVDRKSLAARNRWRGQVRDFLDGKDKLVAEHIRVPVAQFPPIAVTDADLATLQPSEVKNLPKGRLWC